jgi:hypothetical protein
MNNQARNMNNASDQSERKSESRSVEEALEFTVDGSGSYGTGIDRDEVQLMKVAKGNKLYAKLLKGAKRTPRRYSRTEC